MYGAILVTPFIVSITSAGDGEAVCLAPFPCTYVPTYKYLLLHHWSLLRRLSQPSQVDGQEANFFDSFVFGFAAVFQSPLTQRLYFQQPVRNC